MHTRAKLASAALALAPLVAAGSAHAGIRVGGDVASSQPLGANSDLAGPSISGRGVLGWQTAGGLHLGVVGGVWNQSFRGINSFKPALTATVVGLTGQHLFLKKDAQARPFAGLDVGYAGLKLTDGSFGFDEDKTTSQGWFLAPNAGLQATLLKGFDVQLGLRYEYMRSAERMVIGPRRTKTMSNLGLSFGMFLGF